ncbi:methylated-DNA--[protein]-cysteine S-methyltransferase [Cumulibacter manganitolerans]|uniref:methylated-DNA--[protein]-cysteine S-methyltransferase n=1 Tax=Cumulibacter manganitolerans TaxID=1884992 RepID=UPI001297E819|nr:methylated-DNA--[protein]-cysteine S-methyltransferase [Cumulibacter manganitolerans]
MSEIHHRCSRPTVDLPRTGHTDPHDSSSPVVYRLLDTPLGELLLAATARGLVRVAFAVEGFDDVLQSLSERAGPRVTLAQQELDDAAWGIDAYFGGDINPIEIPLDLRLLDEFGRRVAQHLPSIGYGRTSSYAEVAAAVGSPREVDAVGDACRRNPLPIVLPCHRVVPTSGTIGDYVGGAEAKRVLLALEAA